jgi:transcription initiation factor TFIIIB Brf1 subunit/transcription initiation factor TFIIB
LYKRSEDESLSKAARTYNLRREQHVCVKCGGVLDEKSNLLCTAHLDYYNTWHASKRAKIAAALALLDEQQKVAQTTEQKVVKTSKKAKKS